MPEEAAKINQYVCRECGGRVTTVNADRGTTPFMIRCRATRGCKGMAESRFYRVEPGLRPQFEWYRPEGQELKQLDVLTLEHVSRGGLILRRFVDPATKIAAIKKLFW